MKALISIFGREARLAWAGGGGAAGPAAFFLAALTLAPLAIGPDGEVLRAAGPGLISFAALLAALQPAERLFGEDLSDGTLDLYALSDHSLALSLTAKTLGQMAATLFPLPVLALAAAVMYGLSPQSAAILALALACAAPGLALIAGFAGALAAGLKRAGLLIALIAAPLQAPLLIFAAGAARSAESGDGRAGALILLVLALSLFALALAPFGAAAAVRSRLD